MTPAPTASRSRRPILKVVRRLLGCVALAHGVSLALLFLFQRTLIFHAGFSRASVGTAALPAGARSAEFRTAAGDLVSACFGSALRSDGRPDPDSAHCPTLLFFYGQGGSIDGFRLWFQSFRKLGANVLMPDYVGFGRSGGQESEAGCYATAQAAYEYLRTRPDVDPRGIVIVGYSLGSGVATNLTAREAATHQLVAGRIGRSRSGCRTGSLPPVTAPSRA